MKRIDSFISGLNGMNSFVADRKIEYRIKEIWSDVAGQLADQLRISYYRQKSLYLSSNNPVWRAEVEFISQHIIKDISKRLGRKVVDRLIVVDDVVDTERKTVSQPLITTDLPHLISNANEAKRSMGMALCSRCNDVYCFGDICVFCNAEGR
jgi:hypothetical protein